MDGSVRKGVVTAVDLENFAVRVRFPAEDMTSGWLKVVRTVPIISPDDGKNRTDDKTMACETDLTHCHDLNIKLWFPSVGETVLCIYESGFNADGYVIGGL